MTQDIWQVVDTYFEGLYIEEPAYCAAALRATREAKFPDISVSPSQGKFLSMMVAITGARRVLEVGTLGGYSSLWMAGALPAGGQLVTLDRSPVCAAVARANFAHAGLQDRIELRLGDAMDSFKALVGEKGEPFDFIFIDANKPDYPEYLQWCVRLSKSGTVIVADNIVRDGEIVQVDTQDSAVDGVRAFHEAVAADKRLEATSMQTVGSKGYDGFAFVRVL